MIYHNFLSSYPELDQWRPALSSGDHESKSPVSVQISRAVRSAIRYGSEHPWSWVPPSVLLLLSLAIYLLSLPQQWTISRLRSNHSAFDDLITRQQFLQRRLAALKSEIDGYQVFYEIEAPSIAFAYYLQDLTPDRVQLISYSLDRSGFQLQASSNGLDPLNELVMLLSNQPIVAKGSLTLKSLSRPAQSQNPTTASVLNPTAPASADLSGMFLKQNVDQQLNLYRQASSLGPFSKLKVFHTLVQLTSNS